MDMTAPQEMPAILLPHGDGAASTLAQYRALASENAVLTRALAAAQRHCETLVAEHTAALERLSTLLIQTRADCVLQETEIARLRARVAELSSNNTADASAGTAERRLAHQLVFQEERNNRLSRELETMRRRAGQSGAPLRFLRRLYAKQPSTLETVPSTDDAVDLDARHILCVGGAQSSLETYRQLIETAGGRFAHHDGGVDHPLPLLEADLRAADLVICQTGCISHNAYWRVKDHCQRSGKRCVFVDSTGPGSLARGLQELLAEAVATAGNDVQN
ncbi:MAG: hypothetical protein BSR46_13525 [Candidatus Dactylopiibacterium carminicum]|nr:MAG: hypothetical protein BSR46_13525 [Candidatus Dactylopiibacterium carminicum]